MNYEKEWEKVQENLGIKNEEVETPSTETQVEQKQDVLPEENISNKVLKIKFNGVEEEIDEVEAVRLAQLGKLYSNKIEPEYNNLKNHSAIKMVKELAKEYGMTEDEFVNATMVEAEKNRIARIQDEYKIEDDIVAKKIYEQDKKLNELQSFKSKQELDEITNKIINDFTTKYPDVNLGTLDNEVIKRVEKGMDLITSYELFTTKNKDEEINLLRQELEKLKTNNANTNEAPPVIGGDGGGNIVDITDKKYIGSISDKESLDNYISQLKNIYKKNK